MALLGAAYVLTGLAALQLAIEPGHAAPLYPAAGVALAAVLTFGWPALPVVALGALAVNLTLRQQFPPGALGLALPVWIAFGATLQAGAGAWLVRRLVRRPLTLAEPGELITFFLAGKASCLINATLATAMLRWSGVLDAQAAASTWIVWLVGDMLGVMIAAPVVLTLIGRPRGAWAPRRLSVGLSLALAMLLLALGISQVSRWNEERTQTVFRRDAAGAVFAMTARLQEPLHALEALHGVFIASTDVDRVEMRLATRAWLQTGTLQALGWMERVGAADVAAFEARERSEGAADFRVFDRDQPAAPVPPAAPGDRMVIRYIEPLAGNAAALGMNALSIPAARAAIESAVASGRPAATAVFRLTQQQPTEEPAGVVVYQAVYRGPSTTAAERRASVRGVVFATLRVDAQLAGLQHRHAAPYLDLCVVDTDPVDAAARRLAGARGCEAGAPELLQVHEFLYAGRRWAFRVGADPASMPEASDDDTVLFSFVGMLSLVLLAGFLLIVTGRTRRVETAVRQRTAALEAEVREREVAQAALRESERRFRNIFDNAPIGMFYADLQGRLIQVNPSFCELTGYSQDELLRLASADYTVADDLAEDAALQAQLVRGEVPTYRRHKRYIAKSGAVIQAQATVSLLRGAEGEPRHIVGVVEDITEHLRLEEAEQAREVAESSNRAKSDFLSRMSHELRTPLNAMLGFAQLLELDRHHPLDASHRPWVEQIQQAGWHLLEMINDVLDLSRIESGNLRLQIGHVDLRDSLAASLAMIESDARRRRIGIRLDLADDALSVAGDATRIKQVFTNLLSNAVKYNADGGRVRVATARGAAADMVEISISDTGLGMTPEQMAQLFQPFNRLGRERSSSEGTGIGLVVSQRLAELMGGSLRASSVTGEGSSFVLSLPRAADAAVVRPARDLPDEPLPADYHRRVVHYIEDNETNVEVMRGILAQRPQVEMQISVTGLDALAAMRSAPPDLILLDMHLPDISGMELLRHLKADPQTADIAVIAVSADALARQIDEAVDAGAAHYLTKPVNVAELLAVIDKVLDRIDTRFG